MTHRTESGATGNTGGSGTTDARPAAGDTGARTGETA